MEPFVQKDQSFFLIDEWTNKYPDLVAGFTTKHGGLSKAPYESLNFGFHVGDDGNTVVQNRSILSKKLGFPLNQWVGAEQIHQTKIQKIAKDSCGRGAFLYEDSFGQTDGFYTSENGIFLSLVFADCVPLYFFAPKQRLIGIAHAGWKGTAAGIGVEMINHFRQEGINPEEILAAIGPSICGKCYIVDERVISLLQNKLVGVEEKPYNLIKENQYQLSLPLANKLMLKAAGVKEENIINTNLCTSCQNELFFSHRKDKGQTGRMISFIGWKEA
ncbi:peptidoglycan editing factor PgeF [Neobacillus sp. LXY-4]|uniref:peptidoglycan editing factor PgeF n=1 Tax=Neobacillus sp. LXY-4 TaxID=3379826 RepID=UPI003EDED19A